MVSWKGYGRKLQAYLNHCPGICLEGVRKTKIILSQDSPVSGPRFEPGTSRKQSTSANHSATTFSLSHVFTFFDDLKALILVRHFNKVNDENA
jgi:hypothetical protein